MDHNRNKNTQSHQDVIINIYFDLLEDSLMEMLKRKIRECTRRRRH